MKRHTRLLALSTLLLCALAGAAGARQATRPLTVDEILKFRRVGDPQLSPDGRLVAYSVSVPDMEANRSRSRIYVVPVAGGQPTPLTPADISASSPRWSPDGRRIAYTSGSQIHIMSATGGDARKLTDAPLGAADPVWSPDGRLIAYAADIYPECPDHECNRRRAREVENSKVKAHVADRLLYRHWTTWKDGTRTHVFVVPVEGGPARDLTPGDWDAPPFSLGGMTDYAFSPDSRELAYVRNTDRWEATSTNGDIFTVPVAGGEPTRLTGDNKGADSSPRYTRDGRFIVYRSQATPMFESDHWRLMVYDRAARTSREVLPKFGAHVESFAFTSDGRGVYFTTGERGRHPVYTVSLDGGTPRSVVPGFNDDVQVSPDGRFIVFTRSSAVRPAEIYVARLDGVAAAGQAGDPAVQLTRENDEMLRQFGLRPAEELTWQGAGGTQIQGWLVRPADFDPSKKYPLLVMIHGGPQSAFYDNWGYRWNPQVFASAGYVVFQPNPRGSIGFGQQFVNEISGDWAGKVYTDILNGVEKVAALPYVDRDRVGAAGASYGGYMVNWLLGHNDHPRVKFKAFVSHAGVYNLTSMYGVTEELWFAEWEFRGTPWDAPALYEKWSPHRFVKNFNTPTLVTHGEIDYRVPVGEGLQLFTALQRQGVPSRLVVFPDEGHWILKPQNSRFWYGEVIGWLDKHLKPVARG
ncbi:MAG TPA: S9 family peptidase [Pyrinomonadaceae bacterium]|nr:S9 family peptidase [Pyrinomonadaceae bacterium]